MKWVGSYCLFCLNDLVGVVGLLKARTPRLHTEVYKMTRRFDLIDAQCTNAIYQAGSNRILLHWHHRILAESKSSISQLDRAESTSNFLQPTSTYEKMCDFLLTKKCQKYLAQETRISLSPPFHRKNGSRSGGLGNLGDSADGKLLESWWGGGVVHTSMVEARLLGLQAATFSSSDRICSFPSGHFGWWPLLGWQQMWQQNDVWRDRNVYV